MSISTWDTDHEPPPVTVSVNEAYLHELQTDAARWRYVRELMSKLFSVEVWHVDESVDRLIEESQREGK